MGKDVKFELPQPFEMDIDSSMNSFLSMAPVTVDMGLNNIKMDLDSDMNFDGKVDMGLDNVKVDMGLDDVNVDMGLDNINMCMSFAIKELPSMKMQFPVNFDFGIKVLGMSILNFGVCGKAMVLTEDNPKRIFQVPKPPKFTTSAPSKGRDALNVTLADK